MQKKVPLYKKEGDTLVKVGEISTDEMLEELKEEGIEDIDAVYVLEEEPEEEPEEEERNVHTYKPKF